MRRRVHSQRKRTYANNARKREIWSGQTRVGSAAGYEIGAS